MCMEIFICRCSGTKEREKKEAKSTVLHNTETLVPSELYFA